jgi:hypothetical protein
MAAHSHSSPDPFLRPAALDEIVGQVDRWYDAFFRQIAVKAS